MRTGGGPGNALRLTFVYGYRGRLSRQNLFYNADGRIVYHSAALGVVYDKETHEQHFFRGHDDDITALDIHPDKVRVHDSWRGWGHALHGRRMCERQLPT